MAIRFFVGFVLGGLLALALSIGGNPDRQPPLGPGYWPGSPPSMIIVDEEP